MHKRCFVVLNVMSKDFALTTWTMKSIKYTPSKCHLVRNHMSRLIFYWKSYVMCTRLRLACASSKSGQSLLCDLWTIKDPAFLLAQKIKTDQNVQTDFNLRCTLMSTCTLYFLPTLLCFKIEP